MPIENLEERLASLDDTFKSAPMEGGFTRFMPEPGLYQGILREIDFFESKKGQAFLKLVFEIALHPEYAGQQIELTYNLEPDGNNEEREQKLGFLKRDLRTLGIPVESDEFSFAQVRPGSAIWDPVMDVPVSIEVKDSKRVNPDTGKPWRNAYVQDRLGDPLPVGTTPMPQSEIPNTLEPQQQVAADDTIPF